MKYADPEAQAEIDRLTAIIERVEALADVLDRTGHNITGPACAEFIRMCLADLD